MNINTSDELKECYVRLKYLRSNFTVNLILFVSLQKAKRITHFI